MTDPLLWSISAGRWFGVHVRIHVLFLIYGMGHVLVALFSPELSVLATVAWLLLLAVAVALHELTHHLVAAWLGVEAEDTRLWPLGNLSRPAPVAQPTDAFLVAISAPVVNLSITVLCALSLAFQGISIIWNPFGGPKTGGVPYFVTTGQFVSEFSLAWWVGWFAHINLVLFLANLIPAYPLDGGRMARAVLSRSSPHGFRDSMLELWISRTSAVLLLLVGLARLIFSQDNDGGTLIALAALIEWIVRTESRMLEDGGFFDDGVFGYDFSQGYTSLESSTAKVRPSRESALRRWRRKRSESRRQRRMAQEIAEEQRLDEILDKLHRDGRGALTNEENRFLIRISARLKNKSRKDV